MYVILLSIQGDLLVKDGANSFHSNRKSSGNPEEGTQFETAHDATDFVNKAGVKYIWPQVKVASVRS